MKNKLSTALLFSSLTLGSGNIVAGENNKTVQGEENQIHTTLNITKSKTATTLTKEVKKESDYNRKTQEIISQTIDKISELDLSSEEREILITAIKQEDFQNKLYSLTKTEKLWSIENIVLSLILGFLYGWAYFFTIRKIRDQGMPIDAKSFSIFAGTSGMMAILNGFVPGSLVYMESFLLAGASVYLHFQNKRKGVSYKDGLFGKIAQNIPVPVVQYDKSGFPIVWNKHMEEETGYAAEEIIKYHKSNGDIMGLLYKGENLTKVRQYLGDIEESGKGYTNVAFTMTTKLGEEKTFLWNTLPDENGGTIRFARHLTDIGEIRRELKRTEEFFMEELERTRKQLAHKEELAYKDSLTGIPNGRAFEEDMKNLLVGYKKRNMVMAMIDIDDFKDFNDIYGHEVGDAVLKQFSRLIQENLHRKGDSLYRIGGDEFIVLLESDDFDGVVKKLNTLRHNIFETPVVIKDKTIPLRIGSSWGITKFKTGEYPEGEKLEDAIKKIKKLSDEYMYAVKFYKQYLGTELLAEGKIQDTHREKNGIARVVYDPTGEILGVEVHNEYGILSLSKQEFENIRERKIADTKTGRNS